MYSPLDAVREQVGLSAAGYVPPPADAGPPTPARDSSTDGYPFWTLRARRQLLGTATVLDSGVALTHQLLTVALAHSHGLLAGAYMVLNWPLPLAQPILAGIAAVCTGLAGVQTRGWQHLSHRHIWLLLTGIVAAVFGAGPMVLVCLLMAVVITFAVVAAIVLVASLLATLARAL